MKKIVSLIMCVLLMTALCACTGGEETKEQLVPDVSDLSGLDEYGQEKNTDYRYFWKPPQANGYVGDPMPYYENGVYSIFYLQDEGGSLRHSVFRVDTKDFIDYEYKGEALRSGNLYDQDYWIGTGSVVKAENDYYFFYTGHNPNMEQQGEPWEKVMVAKSVGSLDNFVKIKDFEIAPPSEYSQRDFRDPQAYYDEKTRSFDVTVETNAGGVPKIIKYTVSLDLKQITLNGVVFEDPVNGFWNLECADITHQNGKYFMTYSAQPEDTVWYTVSDEKFSGYGAPKRLEGKHFYAPKIVEGDAGTCLVGWVYRRDALSDNSKLYWGGHLLAHKMVFNADDTITLTAPDSLQRYFGYENDLDRAEIDVSVGNRYAADSYESYLLKGEFRYTGAKPFGILLGYGDDAAAYRYVGYDPAAKTLGYRLPGKTVNECEYRMDLEENTEYSFTYIQEGSVGALYIDGVGALSFRTYGTSNKKVAFFSEGAQFRVGGLSQWIRSKKA